MSGYNSNLLFETQVTYEDSDGAFETYNHTVEEPSNPFIQRNEPVVVVQQKINPPSPHNSQNYSQQPVQQQPQQTNHNITTVDFSKLNISNGSNGTNSNGQSSRLSESIDRSTLYPTVTSTLIKNRMDIDVKEPEKLGDGMGSYYVYKVVTRSHLVDNPDYKKETSVLRRYSDFLWLRNVLKETRRGSIIPTLPEKAVLNNHNKDFIEIRRKELEKFLNRVVESDSLVHSNELKIFLEGTDEQFQSTKTSRPGTPLDQSVASPPATESKGIGKITSLFGSGVTAISNLATPVKEIDGWFGDKKMYILQLDANLHKLEEAVSSVIKKRRELAQTMADFASAGLSFSSCEVSHRQDVASSFQRLTEVDSTIKKGMDDLSNNEYGYFEEGIRDYLRVLTSVKELLNDRLDSLYQMQNHERILATKKEKLDKLRMSNPSKVQAMSREVEDASRKLNDSKAEYDRISASAKVELQKFDEKRAYEMKRILNILIRLNLDFYLKSSDQWKNFLTEQHQNGDPNFDTHNKASWGSVN
eukprot:gene10403-12776_t